jgi:hypothetical protein
VEEYMACGMLPLSINFGFAKVVDGETSMSKVNAPLPEFPLARAEGENNDRLLERVELEVENDVGGYNQTEHDACIKSLRNRGCLNRAFEKVRVAYTSCPQPGIGASMGLRVNRKLMPTADLSRNE